MKTLLMTLFSLLSLEVFSQSTSTSFAMTCNDSMVVMEQDTLLIVKTDSSFGAPADSMTIEIISLKEDGRFKQNGKFFNMHELRMKMRQDPKANHFMVRSRVCYWIMAPLAFSCGGAIAALPFLLLTPTPLWPCAVLAVGLAAVAIPFGNASDKLLHKAIDTYNTDLKSTALVNTMNEHNQE